MIIVKNILIKSKKIKINNIEDIYSIDQYIRELTRDYIYRSNGNIK